MAWLVGNYIETRLLD